MVRHVADRTGRLGRREAGSPHSGSSLAADDTPEYPPRRSHDQTSRFNPKKRDLGMRKFATRCLRHPASPLVSCSTARIPILHPVSGRNSASRIPPRIPPPALRPTAYGLRPTAYGLLEQQDRPLPFNDDLPPLIPAHRREVRPLLLRKQLAHLHAPGDRVPQLHRQ